MSRFMFFKLAIQNIKNNRKIYNPYILSSTIIVMMFYIISALFSSSIVKNSYGAGALGIMLRLASVIVGIFAVILIIYINNVLSKKRNKEFALYNILGLDKKRIGLVLFYEVLTVAVVSITFGLISGILLAKASELLLGIIIKSPPTDGFYISFEAVKNSVLLFALVFLFNFIKGYKMIKTSNPIELLYSDKFAEKEPKVKTIKLVVGIIVLILGYYIANTEVSIFSVLPTFFKAVLLVIYGTYLLFEVGTIFILKVLKKNKKFYYNKVNFTTVSGMLYRMKQNATGLASICILSTCVIITFTAIVSLYVGIKGSVDISNPMDAEIVVHEYEKNTEFSNNLIKEINENNFLLTDYIEYKYLDIIAVKQDNNFSFDIDWSKNLVNFLVCSLDDYNKNTSTDYVLEKNQVLVYALNKEKFKTIILGETPYEVIENIGEIFNEEQISEYGGQDGYIIVVNDENTIHEIGNLFSKGDDNSPLSQKITFNTNHADTEINELVSNAKLDATGIWVELKNVKLMDFYIMHGGILYVGIFIGVLFLMATVLIIYYKQIQEGYEDSNRFLIMQKIGMEKELVKKTILRQVLLVFFLPIIIATVHIFFAYKITFRVLLMLGVRNESLFIMCLLSIIAIFIIVYTVIYFITSKIYYNIIKFEK